MHYVYSLQCNNGFYIGCTDDLRARIERHKKGFVPATKNRRPIKLSFYIAMNDRQGAFKLEKYLKSGSGRLFVKNHFLQEKSADFSLHTAK